MFAVYSFAGTLRGFAAGRFIHLFQILFVAVYHSAISENL